MQIKKPFDFANGFKSHCTYSNKRFSELEGFLYSRPNNKRKKFPQFGNKFLPPSKNISLAVIPIMYPSKHNYICDYYPRCIMSSGLMFDEIIMDIIRNKKLERQKE